MEISENKVDRNVEEVLSISCARAGDIYADDFGNRWVVHNDRDGLRLEIEGQADAWIPYWTAMRISLPGLHKLRSVI